MKKVFELPEVYDAEQIKTDISSVLGALEKPPKYFIEVTDPLWNSEKGQMPARVAVLVEVEGFDWGAIKSVIKNHTPSEKRKAREKEVSRLVLLERRIAALEETLKVKDKK